MSDADDRYEFEINKTKQDLAKNMTTPSPTKLSEILANLVWDFVNNVSNQTERSNIVAGAEQAILKLISEGMDSVIGADDDNERDMPMAASRLDLRQTQRARKEAWLKEME